MLATVLIDGFNLLHAVILKGRDRAGWWRSDRQLQVVALAAQLAERAERGSLELPALASASPPVLLELPLHVVFDRRPGSSEAACRSGPLQAPVDPARVLVHHAASADDWIVAECQSRRRATRVVVVSADRALIDRARHHGASRLSPWAFAALCLSPEPTEPGAGEPGGAGGRHP